MNDRVLQLVRSLRQRFGPDADLDEVAAFLTDQGCDGGQIGEVVTRWRATEASPESGDMASMDAGQQPAPLRVLGPHEWGRFAPEAWGRLVALQASGLLSILDFERVIEHALEQGDGRVTLFELDPILDSIGLASTGQGTGTDSVTIH